MRDVSFQWSCRVQAALYGLAEHTVLWVNNIAYPTRSSMDGNRIGSIFFLIYL